MTKCKTPDPTPRRSRQKPLRPNWWPVVLVLLVVVFMLYYTETRTNSLASKVSVIQSELDEAKRHQFEMDSRYHLRKPK